MRITLLFLCTLFSAVLLAKPVPIVFDTDMGNDIDDALALAMAHSLQNMGECEILAVTINKDNPYANVYTDIVNTFYGRPYIPMGFANGSGITPGDGPFMKIASEKRSEDGRFLYPRRATADTPLPEAAQLMRKILAEAEDNSVVFVVLGFSTNMARLLETQPDEISPLSGRDLLAKKGKWVSIMAGDFTDEKTQEWNVMKDVPSARAFFRDCPIPMVFSGVEVGRQVPYPWQSILDDYKWAAHHPVADSYRQFRKGKPHDRPTWDLFSLLYAVRPSDDYCSLSEPGTVSVADDKGTVSFSPSPGGLHRFMRLNDRQKDAAGKAFVALSSRPVQ